MRKLDSYILKNFVLTLTVSTVVLIGLYIVVHFFTRLADFFEIKDQNLFTFIFKYYFYRLPLILVEIMPLITLIAAMLTITRFIKTRELIPIFSAGISIYRVFVPIFAVAALLALVIFFLDENIVPRLIKPLAESDKLLGSAGTERYLVVRDQSDSSILIERYNYQKHEMKNVTVTQCNAAGEPKAQYFARRGQWLEVDNETEKPQWFFYDGVAYFYEPSGIRKGAPLYFGAEGIPVDLDLKPGQLERAEDSVSYSRISDLVELVNQYPHQNYLRVRLYKKLAAPFTNLILLLLGLPLILISESRNVFLGSGICLVVGIAFFVILFLAELMGTQGVIAPAWAVFLPLILLTIIALGLMKKIRT